MHGRGGEQPLLQGLGESQERVAPYIRNRSGRKEEERTAVPRLREPRGDVMVLKRGRVEAQSRLGLVLGVPGRLPTVGRRIGWRIKEKHHGFDIAPCRGDLSDIDLNRPPGCWEGGGPTVPVAQTLAQVDAVFERRCEFFRPRQVCPKDPSRLFANVAGKAFDSLVFRRP